MASTSKRGYYQEGSVEVGPEAAPGETRARRFALTAQQGLVTRPHDGVDTLFDVVQYAARTNGTKNAFGWRDVVGIHEEEKEVKKNVDGKEVTEIKKWKYFELSDYKYINYIEAEQAVNEVSHALVHLGIGKDDVFNIYSTTCLNWQFMSLGCASIATRIATAYDTLGESGLAHSLNEPECVGIFTNDELLPTLALVIHSTPTVKYVVYDGAPKPAVLESIRNARSDVQFFSIDEFRALGKKHLDISLEDRRPNPETVACIMYTSGSTGAPKGVVITHGNLIASVGAVYTFLSHHFKEDDTYLAYLPLAHVLEYVVELCFLFIGLTIGYGRVKTLTDASVRKSLGDLRAFRPNILVSVPAIWELIRKGIVSKVNASGIVRKSVFNVAMAIKRANVPVLSQVVDSAVLSSVKQATGGRLRIALSGGAALSRETQEFLSLALVALLQGYGMTETCGMCAILPPELMQYGSVGLPTPCVEVKLRDVPEAGYFSTNDPPQGEVCLRGPSVTKGYFKRDDLNNDPQVFTADGWLRTGDVGQWNQDGTLSLIDRIKNLIKLQGGEYIALERLESTYRAGDFVGNLCVHATPEAKQPMAIIVPHEANLRYALQQKNVPGASVSADAQFSELCADEGVKELVLRQCNAIGKKNGFKPMEILQAVVLTHDEWTPENGLVTAAQKIQRKKIADRYHDQIKKIYQNE